MSFILSPAEPADVPELTSIYLASFVDPFSLTLFPRTPGVRAWWEQDLAQGFADPNVRMLKVVDDASGRIAAFAKWVLPPPQGEEENEEEKGEALPEWPEDADGQLCQSFFAGLLEAKKRLMGPRPYFYLEMLATHPDFQKRGAASLLLSWGTARADAAGMPAYLDGSPVGVGLYLRHGWEEKGVVVPEVNGESAAERWEKRYLCMVREPRAGETGR
ncbi:acyl-CoA N-acyltransferase [Punctularia strigosozonata HHB-11173 SS5]|uniref:Acyl-CoA N-acyltransferase n=1 Tax=Punctularia strigosozonata (strain HHB-11173) TaxID=741275 RepID=R7S411_PUNST|nr:acyl-CoA N-acyltransferase [Punctularia strigosozonata HHB-11173 SS5]EIN03976.1 acyl-CoA N-acyltransferase [Punctularia strigosozonata HHB-11173 SS5]